MSNKLSLDNTQFAQQQKNLYQLLIDNVSDYAIVAVDSDGVILTWNNGASQMFGYEKDEIVGKSIGTLYLAPETDAGKHEDDLRRAQKNGSVSEEGIRIHKDGTHLLLKIDARHFSDDANGFTGFALVMRDLIERQIVEEKFRQSEEMFTLMVAAVKDYAIFLLDPTGHVMTWNEGAQRIKGYTKQEIVGKHFSQFYPQAAKDIHHPEKELELAEKHGHYEEEGWRLRKDGSQFWASVTITPVKDIAGNLRGFMKVTRDLTERRRTEVERENARQEALKMSELKSQFVANVSHEIRTPMAGIIGMAEELLLDDSLNEEQHEAAELVFNSSMRLLGVLNDILDFSKLEAGRITLEESSFELRKAVQEVILTAQPIASKKDISINTIMGADLPDTIIGDEVKLRQVLTNLVHNAIKFTNEGGVTVEVKRLDDTLRFSVKDTGIGISKADLKNLFQPFRQADSTSRRKYGGTGLGLSIAKRYIELMKGKIGCASSEGEGSEFWFEVPLRSGDCSPRCVI